MQRTIGLQPMEFQFQPNKKRAARDTIALQPMEFQFQLKKGARRLPRRYSHEEDLKSTNVKWLIACKLPGGGLLTQDIRRLAPEHPSN